MKSRPLSEADTRKPDPAEPWRYVCPQCKKQVNGDNSMHGYYCKECEEGWTKDQLFDLKNGRVLKKSSSNGETVPSGKI